MITTAMRGLAAGMPDERSLLRPFIWHSYSGLGFAVSPPADHDCVRRVRRLSQGKPERRSAQ
ncbi:hypothetical protein [Bosea sp. PAMC 26642]|uniref:hypothetical protein n=1 Tax=Bosea sp. (strain PAMC 26642) TaxID=1792307 RepID=UPI000AE70AB2|nr:hypothetical protein [Bosea sp. PAMC 26642]